MVAQPVPAPDAFDISTKHGTALTFDVDVEAAVAATTSSAKPNFIESPGDSFEATMVQAMSLPIVDPRSVHNDSPKAPSDDTSLQDFPTLGYIGRYALKYQLGQGGLGTVYAALDPLLSRPIALKTLRVDADHHQREAFESMLLAEARAAAGLNHPNIVTVFDAGLNEHGVYIAMEMLKGEDLKQRLASGWRPDANQAATVLARVAEALDYAHRQGVVHCDVKPANIFMVDALNPKVVDFGIAKVAHAAGVDIPLQLAPADALSPYYASPEQIQGGTIDARSDVYSLGVVLYELLTGTRPYAGETLDALKQAVVQGNAATAQQHTPLASSALSAIAARAMAREPHRRYRSAGQLALALQRCADHVEALRAQRRRITMGIGLGVAASVMGAAVWWSVVRPDGIAATGSVTAGLASPSKSTMAGLGLLLPDVGSTSVNVRSPFVDGTLLANEVARAASAGHAFPAAATPTAGKSIAKADTKTQGKPNIKAAATATTGSVQLAVAPWGHIEVNGKPAGVTPPLNSLSLPTGSHKIVIRNADFPPHIVTVVVDAQRSAIVRHRFGS